MNPPKKLYKCCQPRCITDGVVACAAAYYFHSNGISSIACNDKTFEHEEKLVAVNKKKGFRVALNSGVTIVAGGDVGVFTHGDNVRELEIMVDYGMKTMDVLKSVTSINAQVFGLENLGQLRKGFYADIIAIDGDPIEDISALYSIQMVMKDGKIYFEDD